jgi:hypothetical protein
MSNGWFYIQEGWIADKSFGPFNDQEFFDLFLRNEIKQSTQVLHPKHTQGAWARFIEIPAYQHFESYKTRREADAQAFREQQRQAETAERKRIADLDAAEVKAVKRQQAEVASNSVPARIHIIQPMELPNDIRVKIQSGEIVYHFGYIDTHGGCANQSTAKQWLLVTDRRILFEAMVKQGTGNTIRLVQQSGSIPTAKVSYVGTSTILHQGCANVPVTFLVINSSGGEITLVIPTQKEAARFQGVIDAIISTKP